MKKSLPPWACLLLVAACSTPSLKMTEEQYNSIISIDEKGESPPIAVKRTHEGNFVPTENTIRKHVDGIADSIETFLKGTPACSCKQNPSQRETCEACSPDADRILIYIHGGLVKREDALTNAKANLNRMKAAGDFYPIFINWETDMWRSYVNRTLWIRDGRREPLWGPITSPLFVLADIGRALGRSPITYGAHLLRKTYDGFNPIEVEAVPAKWESQAYIERFAKDTKREPMLSRSGFNSVIPGIVRPFTMLVLDTGGVPAYLDMKRRADLLFTEDDNFDTAMHPPTGALTHLMDRILEIDGNRLEAVNRSHALCKLWRARDHFSRARNLRHEQRESGEDDFFNEKEIKGESARGVRALASFNELSASEKPIHVTIVAHSMGSHVANEIVRRYPDLHFENIVYMGAACSIRDWAENVIPYMHQNPDTEFYNLTLHPKHEQNDRYASGAAPHGSLLVWIDSFITRHDSGLDATLGRWNNVMRALPVARYMTSDLRERIHVRAFGDGGPRDHGDFNNEEFRFWEESFWAPPIPSGTPANR